ncbi:MULTISPECIES: hypothetical protein [unclassified Bosea (in: a-proteobacteria)]|uniref:hypothetical protein n=1 Tax=unclassified Bosea (in: a-proteobacteria) TaxID=2653178 RepID=UPI0012FD89D8|nr:MULTISPECIES: hypothetical protein [unclassified Bosea (in: a-proteobacteria)]MBN9459524.1 hypothetical protein [Bosea sp. (in: a-proteobacteria)]
MISKICRKGTPPVAERFSNDDRSRRSIEAVAKPQFGVLRLKPHHDADETRYSEPGLTDQVRSLVNMVGGAVAVDMSWDALVRLALVMRMPVLRDRYGKFGMAQGFGLSHRIDIVARLDVDRGQQHREHRQEGGREARSASDAATRHTIS